MRNCSMPSGEVVSPNVYEYYVTFVHTSGGRAVYVWPRAYPVAVSHGEVHEDPQRLRANVCQA
jgi:hypothetical protein